MFGIPTASATTSGFSFGATPNQPSAAQAAPSGGFYLEQPPLGLVRETFDTKFLHQMVLINNRFICVFVVPLLLFLRLSLKTSYTKFVILEF